jgi:hypothetical protein
MSHKSALVGLLLNGDLVPCPNVESKFGKQYNIESMLKDRRPCGALFLPWPMELVRKHNRTAQRNDFACPVCYLRNTIEYFPNSHYISTLAAYIQED